MPHIYLLSNWFSFFLLHDIFVSFFPRYLGKTLIVNFQIYFKALTPIVDIVHIGEIGKMKGTDVKKFSFPNWKKVFDWAMKNFVYNKRRPLLQKGN